MLQSIPLSLSRKQLVEFCQRHHIRKLSLFGSILRDDFTETSDIDFLVEFDAHHIPGYLRLSGMEIELSEIIGRKADLRTVNELSHYFRQQVLLEALVQYVED